MENTENTTLDHLHEDESHLNACHRKSTEHTDAKLHHHTENDTHAKTCHCGCEEHAHVHEETHANPETSSHTEKKQWM